jgi:hypothetical protein
VGGGALKRDGRSCILGNRAHERRLRYVRGDAIVALQGPAHTETSGERNNEWQQDSLWS